jgi:hypothetical protein
MCIWKKKIIYFWPCLPIHSTQEIEKRGPKSGMDCRTKYHTSYFYLFYLSPKCETEKENPFFFLVS